MPTDKEVADEVREVIGGSPGVKKIETDGVRVEMDKSQLDYWERRYARKTRKRPLIARIDLSDF